MTGRARHQKP